jgi:sirohydrochlorin ferrochelatase
MHERHSESTVHTRHPKTALLLIANGSRHAEANADLDHVVAAMRRRGLYDIVEPSFLELAEPTGEQAGARCVEQGAERVIFLPYFLSAGVHVQCDLTEICRRLSERFPEVVFHLAEPLGRHPLLLDVMADRARQAEREMAGK